jgi:hypothetical protein
MTTPTSADGKPRELKISCTASDCQADLHCFKPAPRCPRAPVETAA